MSALFLLILLCFVFCSEGQSKSAMVYVWCHKKTLSNTHLTVAFLAICSLHQGIIKKPKWTLSLKIPINVWNGRLMFLHEKCTGSTGKIIFCRSKRFMAAAFTARKSHVTSHQKPRWALPAFHLSSARSLQCCMVGPALLWLCSWINGRAVATAGFCSLRWPNNGKQGSF